MESVVGLLLGFFSSHFEIVFIRNKQVSAPFLLTVSLSNGDSEYDADMHSSDEEGELGPIKGECLF